jgi:hypothetical protein
MAAPAAATAGLMSELHDTRLGRVESDTRSSSTLPHLATKAELTTGLANVRTELADKPGKTYLATAIGVLIAAYALLASLVALR